ncbi:quinoprotein dehydrogenase-associated SoxYZ-like carrier [Ideonella sp. 4Y11]|uniref:Quinoprotein dehydrogenase-associated SoxYZ-like carrier n=1 Tax=Ideonella aquatica TaxID=2824119 RepID=A0A940YKB9_9BURK|nr:quinoprotein dehydrogenase-associated SoxYZ-like carrier [Ideonella aquatica]MBQ0961119.1 quinoprotein dehydrogenase-associated SoxYZ-like carrier [Ideonella aquatica]
MLLRRDCLRWLGAAAALAGGLGARADEFEGDPYRSHVWIDMRREYLGGGRVVYDQRVQVQAPAFAEDPMNVPVSVRVDPALGPIEQIVVLVDRNPIKRVVAFQPMLALPSLSLRFKLEQASPIRAAARTADGVWHVGGTEIDSAGGGCTVSGDSRKDGSWSRTLGELSGRVFALQSEGPSSPAARLRLRVMHPMDTGLVGGVPAFFVNRLSVQDGQGRELARLQAFEPVSENPVFSLDFRSPPAGGVRIVGADNNGNRIDGRLE